MKLRFPFARFLLVPGLILLSLAAQLWAQDHGHLNVGAADIAQGAPLMFVNGADFAEPSGYVKSLVFTNAGRFAGYYHGNITLTVLPATPAYAGPDPDAPAVGSFIQFRMDCLEAPKGGTFGFWDASTTQPSLSLERGQTSTNLWRLTETDGSVGADPYGHIHGRRFTGSRSGLYKIAFTAVDTSSNGAGGGPIHSPSAPVEIWFAAGVVFQSIRLEESGSVRVRFSAMTGATWQVERASTLIGAPEWIGIGGTVTGDDHFHELTDPEPASRLGNGFYRIRQIP